MSYNWPIITDKLYGIIKGSCKDLMMYDAKGNETIDPKEGTRFFATFGSNNADLETFTILAALHDEGQNSFINIKTPDLSNDTDFNCVYELRNHIRTAIGQREGIKVNWQVFDHAIDPKEEAVHNIKESKDVSKVFGTTKSSFQRIGEAKLILRHTDTINEEKHGARTRHIRAIFVENKLGERFAYPHMHVTGARAFARHISNGGTNHDAIAEGIFGLSEKYLQLRRSGTMLRRSAPPNADWVTGIREGMQTINRKLKSLHGPKGYSNADTILSENTVIIDNNAIADLQSQMAESCGCQQGMPGYDDFGAAARVISMKPQSQPTPMTFTWKSRPDITSAADQYPHVLERLAWQLGEIAGACEDPMAAQRISEISMKIATGVKPTSEDLELVREAFTSSQAYEPEVEILPEEAELEAFLGEYEPERIFAEDQDSIVRYIPGVPGEIIKQEGDIYLMLDVDRYDRYTTKNEYEVYKKIGDNYHRIENLDMPYDRGYGAVAKFEKNLPMYHAWQPTNTGDKIDEWDEDPDHVDSQRADAIEANIEYYLKQMNITSPITMDQAEHYATSIEQDSGITYDEIIDHMEQRGMIIPGEDDHLSDQDGVELSQSYNDDNDSHDRDAFGSQMSESPDTIISRMQKLAGI
jgi:hypothetical protein